MQIQKKKQVSDGWGGVKEQWERVSTPKVNMWLDMISGTDKSVQQNAIVEESTHILIIEPYLVGITDDMRVVDDEGRVYAITYADNPVGQSHHNEIYLEYQSGVSAYGI